MKTVYTILKCSLLTVLELGSYYHAGMVLDHSAPPFLPLSPATGVTFHVKNLNDVGVILPKEETNYQLCMAIIQIIKMLILAKAAVQ